MGTKLYVGTTQYTPANNLLTTTDINAFTPKTTAVANDLLLIEDSASSYAKKKVAFGNFVSSDYFGNGEAFQYIGETESTDTIFQTTSTTYQDVITLTSSVTAGDYVIFCNGRPIATNCDYRIYNSTDAVVVRYMAYDVASPCGYISACFTPMTLTTKSYSFIYQFRSLTNGQLRYLRYPKLVLFRVR